MTTNKNTLPLWGKDIDNETMKAASMPKAYARTTAFVDLSKALDGNKINFTKISRQYQVGDALMFIPADNLADSLANNQGTVCTIVSIENGIYEFDVVPADPTGLHYVVLYRANDEFEADKPISLIPVTIEDITKDRAENGGKLRQLGIRCPGWYRWRQVTAEPEGRKPVIFCELAVSMKNFHQPEASGDSADTFKPVVDPDTGDVASAMKFNTDGEVTLG